MSAAVPRASAPVGGPQSGPARAGAGPGPPAIGVLFSRDASATSDNFYQLFSRPFGLIRPPGLMVAVVPLLVAAGWLLLRRLPRSAGSCPRSSACWCR